MPLHLTNLIVMLSSLETDKKKQFCKIYIVTHFITQQLFEQENPLYNYTKVTNSLFSYNKQRLKTN